MNNNSEKIYSKSMTKMLAVIEENRVSRLTPDSPKFIDYAWKWFNPLKVTQLLLSEETFYNGLREMLFAGFCTWVVCPKSPLVGRRARIREAVDYVSDIEQLALEASEDEPLSIVLAHNFGLGPDFLKDFYFPIGGGSLQFADQWGAEAIKTYLQAIQPTL